MKRTSLAVLLVLASVCVQSAQAALAPQSAPAQESSLPSFFGALEGHWEGTGQVTQNNPSVGAVTSHYRMDMQTERSPEDGTWSTQNNISYESGSIAQNGAYYTVQENGGLWVTSGGVSEPVQILESTPLSLTFRIQRSDVFTGQLYELVFNCEIDATGKTLQGHNTVQTNGVPVSDETFTAQKW